MTSTVTPPQRITVNGTAYHQETAPAVIAVLENARTTRKRIRVHYGDRTTGRDWLEENDVCGTVGRSTGSEKIPLLIASARSLGGGGILSHCIVKITTTTNPRRVLYSHPKYHHGKPQAIETPVEIDGITYALEVTIDGEVHARFRTAEAGKRWLSKMGLSNN